MIVIFDIEKKKDMTPVMVTHQIGEMIGLPF